MKRLITFMRRHKKTTVFLLLIVATAAYLFYRSSQSTAAETRYVLSTVEKGSVIATVTGTGQVSASNQVDVKPKVSGDLISINVQQGQTVKAGALLAQIDAQDAFKAVRDAKTNLETAQLSLQKLQQPATELSLLQAQNSLISAQQSKDNAENDLDKAYDDAFTAISNAFLDLPSLVNGVHDLLYKTTYTTTQDNHSFYRDAVLGYNDAVIIYANDAVISYQKAQKAYDAAFMDYKATGRASDTTVIEALLSKTYDTTRTIGDAIKSSDNFLNYVKDRLNEHSAPLPGSLAVHQASLATFTGKANSNTNALLNAITSIERARDAISAADRSIAVSQESLKNVQAGTDPLDVRSSQLSIQQRQNALSDAQSALADYSVRAPFDGVIAKVPVKKGDPVGSGTSIVTLTTQQQIATITLNEVDAAKVKVGQKVTLTFDAISELSITGGVASIDTIGTVSQGVVTYTVTIGFDTQDDRIKPGMSVSASIITDMRQGVLTVANGAIKTQNASKYVEILEHPDPQVTGVQGVTSATAPTRQSVETGLANDTVTEIVSGLKEGDTVVSRTISPTTQATSQAPSLFGGSGSRGIGR